MYRSFVRTALKLLPFAVGLADFTLLRLRLIDVRAAVGLIALAEGLLTLLGVFMAVRAIRRFQQRRGAGVDGWAAFEDALGTLFVQPLAKSIALEARVWRCLFHWVSRRAPSGPNVFPYQKRSLAGTVLFVVLFLSPVELLLYELLIPWQWLRLILLILGVYTIFWAIAYYASLTTLPHQIDDQGLWLRYGFLASIHLPFAEINQLSRASDRSPSGREGLHVTSNGTAYLGVGGKTNLVVHLRSPRRLHGLLRDTKPVSTIHFAADEPDRLLSTLEAQVG